MSGSGFAWSKDYPWIDYKFDFGRLSHEAWIALGECGSIFAHIANIPLAPDEWMEMHQVYLAKGVLATTAIEGNTLSEDEVRKAVEGELTLPQSRDYLRQEVENVIAVFNEVVRQIHGNALPDITPELLRHYNERVLEGLPLPDEVVAGEFRRHRVGVGAYRCPPAEHLEEMVRTLCERLRRFDEMSLDQPIRAVLKAVIAHLYVAWIHPFGDGNGRTARLLEAMILLKSSVPSPAAHLLSNFYNSTRSEYYRVLDRAGKARDPLAFVGYAVAGLRDELRDQRAKLMEKVWKVVWKNHIYATFDRKKKTARTHRQQRLALELAKHTGPLRLGDMGTMSAEVALLYGNKRSFATLRRDVLALVKDDLVRAVEIDHQWAYETNIQSLGLMLPPKSKPKAGGSAAPN
jgi:Fic family protein